LVNKLGQIGQAGQSRRLFHLIIDVKLKFFDRLYAYIKKPLTAITESG
jgi:hypothetical protein